MNFYPTDNYIDGVEFVSLTLPEIREMVPPIGLAKKIVKLIPKVCVYMDVLVCFCHFILTVILIASPPSALPIYTGVH